MPSVPRQLSGIAWDEWIPTETATQVFVLEGDSVLLIEKKRGLGAGKIVGPGGRVESGETIRECAVRELQEELGITPKALSESGENRFQFVDGYGLHVHVFVARKYEGTPRETDEAVPRWFELASLPYDEMWEDDYLWLPLVFGGTPFAGRYIFDGDVMLDGSVVRWPT